MKVEIKNMYLEPAIKLLFDLPLKRKQSRHRTKFVKLLNEQLKDVMEQKKEIIKEHANSDENGEPKTFENENGQQEYDFKDKKAFQEDMEELYEEKLIIEGSGHKEVLETVKGVLLETDEEFKGQQAMVYDYLCDQLEEGVK
jgi:hypothetical protein